MRIRNIMINFSLPVELLPMLFKDIYAAGDHFLRPIRYISLMKYGYILTQIRPAPRMNRVEAANISGFMVAEVLVSP